MFSFENTVAEIKEFLKDFFKNDFSGHDYLHTKRVFDLSLMLQKKEGGDVEIIALAALLHDVDDKKISTETYKEKNHAVAILEKVGIEREKIDKIISIISSVSFSDNKISDSIEAKIVQDADRLDAIGAIGIARCFAYGGNKNLPIYSDSDIDNISSCNSDSSLAHFYKKLLLIESKMNLESSKKIARKRAEFLNLYLENLINDIKMSETE